LRSRSVPIARKVDSVKHLLKAKRRGGGGEAALSLYASQKRTLDGCV
jgi:hypothetical protein